MRPSLTVAGPENADRTRLADVAMNLATKFGNLARAKLGSAVLVEPKLACIGAIESSLSGIGRREPYHSQNQSGRH
jgi:hypothetical protein